MMTSVLFLVFLFYLNVTTIDSARILAVFPTPSISHQVVFRKLINGLVERGHEITVITTDPEYPPGQAKANLREIDVHNITYTIWKEKLNTVPIGKEDYLMVQFESYMGLMLKTLKAHLEIKEVHDIINKKTGEYDLLLLEGWVNPILIFSHIYKIPVIQVSSFYAIDFNIRYIGATTHPFLYPSMFHQRQCNLTRWEKLRQMYRHLYFEYILAQAEKVDDEELKLLFGPNTPSIRQLADNVQMLFLNSYPFWVNNQPVPPSVVYIGGIHTTRPKELPEDLKTYLDSSKNGVIYFSLGTNANPSLLSPEVIQTFKKVFSELPYDVLWKWNQDELPGSSSNVKISKWFPQADILRHPKVKLFITQGGLQSTDEAIIAGVPLVGIPMLGDQWYNVEKYVQFKIGVRLDIDDLNENSFKNAILTVINDESYRENILKLRNLTQDQIESPLDRAVWWTEHLLRHKGAQHLRAPGANITWAQYLELELVLIVFLALIVILSVVFIAIYRLSNFLRYYSNIKIKML